MGGSLQHYPGLLSRTKSVCPWEGNREDGTRKGEKSWKGGKGKIVKRKGHKEQEGGWKNNGVGKWERNKK